MFLQLHRTRAIWRSDMKGEKQLTEQGESDWKRRGCDKRQTDNMMRDNTDEQSSWERLHCLHVVVSQRVVMLFKHLQFSFSSAEDCHNEARITQKEITSGRRETKIISEVLFLRPQKSHHISVSVLAGLARTGRERRLEILFFLKFSPIIECLYFPRANFTKISAFLDSKNAFQAFK